MATRRAYGGVSAEQRREQRRAALLAAGLEVIGTKGFAKLTVAGLVATAGLNERYYYESFDSLDTVLTEVFDAVVAELAVAILGAVAAAPDGALDKARAAIGAGVRILTDDPRKKHVVFVEGPTQPTLSVRRAEIMRAFAALVVQSGQEHYGDEHAATVGERAQFAALHLVGGLYETMTSWLAGELPLTREQLVEQSAGLFVLVGQHLVEGGPARA
jgi:AcrR family transcriptional regulator